MHFWPKYIREDGRSGADEETVELFNICLFCDNVRYLRFFFYFKASSIQASEDPRTSLSALDCGCDTPALPVGYTELWPGTVSSIHSFLPEVTLGQGVLAGTDTEQSQPVG